LPSLVSKRELDGLLSELDGLSWKPRTPIQRGASRPVVPQTVRRKSTSRRPISRQATSGAGRTPRFPSTPPPHTSASLPEDKTLIRRQADPMSSPKDLPVVRYIKKDGNGPRSEQLQISDQPFIETGDQTPFPLQITWKPPSPLANTPSRARERYPTLNPGAIFVHKQTGTPRIEP